MPRKSSGSTLWPSPLSSAAPSVGVWETDIDANRTRGDAVMARLFGWSEAEAVEGVSMARLLSAFHPDDLAQDLERRRRVREEGGVFVWEHRVVPVPGVVRWVLARGNFSWDAVGRMFGRGIVIDVTDSRSDGYTEGPARFLTEHEVFGPLLERMAERALEILEMMRDLDTASAKPLQPLIAALLRELGHQITASLSDEVQAAPRLPDLTVH